MGLFHRKHRDDVGMVERGEALRFALESREPIHIQGEELGQDLKGDVPIEL